MRKLLTATILLMLLAAACPVSNHSQTAATAYIQATSTGYGWTLRMVGSRGTFVADGVNWTVEYILQSPGDAGFKHTLWLLGRHWNNLMLLWLFTNDEGNSFIGIYYNYKDRTERAERFAGTYNVMGLKANPTYMEGYVPRGRVPMYKGQDFRVSSPHCDLTPQGGTISYQGMQLTAYPVYNVIVTPTWSEFWVIAIDPTTSHTYYLIFYTNSSFAWVVDLWSGQVSSTPLGRATLTGGTVTVEHNVEL